MIPARFHNHPDGFQFDRDERGRVRLNIGLVGRQALHAHQISVAATAAEGIGLILDEVVLDAQIRRGWQEHLAGLDLFTVGVHCELAELERREKARGDRMIGQARRQFEHVHEEMRYDLEVDSGALTPAQVAKQILATRTDW